MNPGSRRRMGHSLHQQQDGHRGSGESNRLLGVLRSLGPLRRAEVWPAAGTRHGPGADELSFPAPASPQDDLNDIQEIVALHQAALRGENPVPASGDTEDLLRLLET